MDNNSTLDIERALDDLAHSVNARAPSPSGDLIARVLADAAQSGPVAVAVAHPVPPRAAAAAPRLTLGEILFGWTGSAVAVMALCLVLGLGIGLKLETNQLHLAGLTGPDGIFEASFEDDMTEVALFMPETTL